MDQDVYKYALKLLNKKNYFTEELRAALLKRYPDEDPALALQSLKEDRYLDDDRQLAAFVRWKAAGGYGPYYIREKLKGKGVEVSVQEIQAILASEEVETEGVIRDNVRKYIRLHKNKDGQALVQGCLRYLAYRGFNTADVLKVIKSEIADKVPFAGEGVAGAESD